MYAIKQCIGTTDECGIYVTVLYYDSARLPTVTIAYARPHAIGTEA